MSSPSLSLADLRAIRKSYVFYSSIIIVSIGLIGNILNIIVFKKLKIFRGNVSCFYLNFESFINIIYLIFTFILNILFFLGNNPAIYSIVWCKIQLMIYQILPPLILSILCLTAFDQFLSTCPIFYIRQFSTIKSARYCLFIIGCFWILHSIPLGIFASNLTRTGCFLTNAIYIQYHLYFYYPVVLGFLPITIASVFSLFAFRNVRRIVRRGMPIIRRKLDQQMTALVFARVITFVILYSPYIGFSIYTFSSFSTVNLTQFTTNLLTSAVIASLLFLNSSITFYVFLLSSSRYRRQVKRLLIKKFWCRCKKLRHTNQNQIFPLKEISVNCTSNTG